jgi:hypothetical protein
MYENKVILPCLLVTVLLISLSLSVSCGSSSSPSSTVTAFYTAGNSGEYDKAKEYLFLSNQMDFELLGMSFERSMDNVTRNGSIGQIKVRDGEVLGEGYSIVYVTLVYKDGQEAEDTIQLMKSSGKWKIVMSILMAIGSGG